jgi:hypothetical protein
MTSDVIKNRLSGFLSRFLVNKKSVMSPQYQQINTQYPLYSTLIQFLSIRQLPPTTSFPFREATPLIFIISLMSQQI